MNNKQCETLSRKSRSKNLLILQDHCHEEHYELISIGVLVTAQCTNYIYEKKTGH